MNKHRWNIALHRLTNTILIGQWQPQVIITRPSESLDEFVPCPRERANDSALCIERPAHGLRLIQPEICSVKNGRAVKILNFDKVFVEEHRPTNGLTELHTICKRGTDRAETDNEDASEVEIAKPRSAI